MRISRIAILVAESLFWVAVIGLVLIGLTTLGCSESGGSVLNPEGLETPIVGVEIVEVSSVINDTTDKIEDSDLKGWQVFSDVSFRHDDLVVAVSVVKFRHGREIEERIAYAIIPKGEKHSSIYLFKNDEEWGDEFRIQVLETPNRNTLPLGQIETEDGVSIPRNYPWYTYGIHGVVRYES